MEKKRFMDAKIQHFYKRLNRFLCDNLKYNKHYMKRQKSDYVYKY